MYALAVQKLPAGRNGFMKSNLMDTVVWLVGMQVGLLSGQGEKTSSQNNSQKLLKDVNGCPLIHSLTVKL
jgi:hypothetical protein